MRRLLFDDRGLSRNRRRSVPGEKISMSDAADAPPRSETDSAAPVPPAEVTTTPPKSRKLLPFYAANLAALYLPSLLPIALEVRHAVDDEARRLNVRSVAIDVLAAPWIGLDLLLERGVFALSDAIGSIGSLYAFLLSLWLGTLLLSVAYCRYAHRYRLTFVLFVLSTIQAIFVADRIVTEQDAKPQAPVAVPFRVVE